MVAELLFSASGAAGRKPSTLPILRSIEWLAVSFTVLRSAGGAGKEYGRDFAPDRHDYCTRGPDTDTVV